MRGTTGRSVGTRAPAVQGRQQLSFVNVSSPGVLASCSRREQGCRRQVTSVCVSAAACRLAADKERVAALEARKDRRQTGTLAAPHGLLRAVLPSPPPHARQFVLFAASFVILQCVALRNCNLMCAISRHVCVCAAFNVLLPSLCYVQARLRVCVSGCVPWSLVRRRRRRR